MSPILPSDLRTMLASPASGKPPPALDLLRERRLEIGQQTIASVLSERRGLLLRGFTIGAVLLGVVLGATSLVYLRHTMVKSQMGELNQVEEQAATLRQELARRQKRLQAITGLNQQLSEALTSVRPTSALMSELQLRTPQGVQLLSADYSDANLVLRGMALDPLAFARINAMQLELRRSPLIDPASTTINKLERKDPPGVSIDPKVIRPIPVQFELTARLTQLKQPGMQQVLRQLGSTGMARRIELLQEEGLLR